MKATVQLERKDKGVMTWILNNPIALDKLIEALAVNEPEWQEIRIVFKRDEND